MEKLRHKTFTGWLDEIKKEQERKSDEKSLEQSNQQEEDCSKEKEKKESRYINFNEFAENYIPKFNDDFGKLCVAEVQEYIPNITEVEIMEYLNEYYNLSESQRDHINNTLTEANIDEMFNALSLNEAPNNSRRNTRTRVLDRISPLAAIGTVGGALVGGGVGAVVGFLIARVLGAFITTIYVNRREIGLRFGGKIRKRTRDYVFKLYWDAAVSLINKRDLGFKIKQSGKSMFIESLYVLPNKQAAKIELKITEEFVAIVPHNTGGSMSLDRINFNNGTMDVPTASMGSLDMSFVGNSYKVPKRALNYQQDMLKIWWITIDMLSELLADYSEYFAAIVRKMQAHKKQDTQAFIDALITLDLTKDYLTVNDPEVMRDYREKFLNKPITPSML